MLVGVWPTFDKGGRGRKGEIMILLQRSGREGMDCFLQCDDLPIAERG